jgi:Tol biopolymer transport system component
MMTRLVLAMFAALLAAAPHIGAQQSNPALDKLFASAQHKATVAGDLKGAIEDYKRIVATAGKDRAVAAQALLRMAEAYQKLGDAEAQRIYERLVHDYPDQKGAAKTAASRLTAMALNAAVWERAAVDVYGGLSTNARVSRDGQLIAYPDWSTGNLMLRDLAKNTDRQLTKDGDVRRNRYAQQASFSPDGRRIAFGFLDNVKRRYEVRMVTVGDAGPPEVIFDREDVKWVQPYDWSLDSARIAMQIERTDGTWQIALLNVADRTARVLVSFPWAGGSSEMRFSPDGRYLAFDLTTEPSRKREVFVIPTDGSCCQNAVVEHIADEQVLGWALNGSELLFWSDRTGEWGLWRIAITNGRATGTARLVRANVHGKDAFAPLGLTAAGDVITAALRIGSAGIQVAQMDVVNGRLLSAPVDVGPELATPFYGWTSYAWSPTGHTLAVYRRTAMKQQVFSFKDFTAGTVREIPAPESDCAGGIVWSKDGRFLVCYGSLVDPLGRMPAKAGIVRVDLATGHASFLTTGRSPALSPDDRTVYVVRGDFRAVPLEESAVIRIDLTTGTEREVLRRPVVYAVHVSPDGRRLVAQAGDPLTKTRSLLMFSPDGGDVREMLVTPDTGAGGSVFWPVFWSPDSQTVFVRRSTADGKPVFVRITLDGHLTEYPGLELGGNVQLSADGQRVAFTGSKKVQIDVHRLRNVLAVEGGR